MRAYVYLVSLSGLAIFYALERLARTSRGRRRIDSGEDKVEPHVFWLHIVSFAVYNVLIAYLLLHREESGSWPLLMYFLAMSLHFFTNDFGLRQDQKDLYDHLGRWVIAAAVVLGWVIGAATTIPELYIGFLFAFLAGAVLLNVLKEELPEERKSSLWPFALGAAGFAALLLVVR